VGQNYPTKEFRTEEFQIQRDFRHPSKRQPDMGGQKGFGERDKVPKSGIQKGGSI